MLLKYYYSFYPCQSNIIFYLLSRFYMLAIYFLFRLLSFHFASLDNILHPIRRSIHFRSNSKHLFFLLSTFTSALSATSNLFCRIHFCTFAHILPFIFHLLPHIFIQLHLQEISLSNSNYRIAIEHFDAFTRISSSSSFFIPLYLVVFSILAAHTLGDHKSV